MDTWERIILNSLRNSPEKWKVLVGSDYQLQFAANLSIKIRIAGPFGFFTRLYSPEGPDHYFFNFWAIKREYKKLKKLRKRMEAQNEVEALNKRLTALRLDGKL